MSTPPVSAEADVWKRIILKIEKDSNKFPVTPEIKLNINEEVPYADQLEAEIVKWKDRWKKTTLEQVKKSSSYPLLRPQKSPFKLVKSFGVELKNPKNQPKGNEWWITGFYEIFDVKNSKVVVSQSLDSSITEVLKDPEQSVEYNYSKEYEKIKIAKDAIGMFADYGKEKYLSVIYITPDRNGINLTLRGDATKEDLISIAKSYMGKKKK
jgi:hypothetical protein